MDERDRAKRRFKIAMAVTIALAAGIAATWFFVIRLPSPAHVQASVLGGTFGIIRHSDTVPTAEAESCRGETQWVVNGWHASCLYPMLIAKPPQSSGAYHWVFYFPLWPLLLPSAIVAFRAHRTIRRLLREGCKHCGYSRAGLAADAPCPECGTSQQR